MLQSDDEAEVENMEESDMTHKKLAGVLAANPFTPKIINKWKGDLQSFLAGQIRFSQLNFALDSDRDLIKEYQNKNKANDEKRLHQELLPQPFQGNPNAPIWVLLLNPGYSDMDRYDHLGLCPSCNKNLAALKNNSQHDVFDYGRNKGRALQKRQNALLRQLRFENECSFSLLDNAFNTLKHMCEWDLRGGYRWWQKVLFGDKGSSEFLLYEFQRERKLEEVIGKKIFALEYFPYHLSNFNHSPKKIGEEYRLFWKELVEWGVRAKRKFIVRGKYMDNDLKILNVNSANSVHFKNHRNVVLTRANLDGDKNVIDAIVNCLKANKQKGK